MFKGVSHNTNHHAYHEFLFMEFARISFIQAIKPLILTTFSFLTVLYFIIHSLTKMVSISYYFQLFIYIHYTILEIIRRVFEIDVKREGREIEEGKQFFRYFLILCQSYVSICIFIFFHYIINMAYQPLTTQGTK